ncbi:MAG TPA: MFS transporter, partial [Rhizobiaceae bacterium]|nr:MFS transporter [Rhizobiaceae bacterium]
VCGALIARLGSTRPGKWMAFGAMPALLWVTVAPNVIVAGFTMVMLGGLIGAMDVAMNANAVSVEKSMRRAIMSSCHGFWSLGGVLGAVSGGFALQNFGALPHAIAITVFGFAVLALLWRHMLEDRPQASQKEPLRLPRSILPWALGIMALFSMIPEGAVLDWGALYLRQELGADVFTSGLAFGLFSATMATMRFAGDFVRDRFGPVATVRVSAAIAAIGLMIAGLADSAPMAIAGFAFSGIGIANLVPIAFSAAGNLPGMAPGIGLSVVTFMGYSGILAAPSGIGFVAEHTGFAPVFIALSLMFTVVLALSPLARHAAHQPSPCNAAPVTAG